MIGPSVALLYFSDSMVSSTPKILNIVQSHPIKCKAALKFMALVDPSSHCMSFRLATNEYFTCNENGTVVAARDNFGEFGLWILSVVDLVDIEHDWGFNRVHHLLSSKVFVIACKVNNSSPTTREN